VEHCQGTTAGDCTPHHVRFVSSLTFHSEAEEVSLLLSNDISFLFVVSRAVDVAAAVAVVVGLSMF
jgi:hypothetical protein